MNAPLVSEPPRRKQSRDTRRQQLIESTIAVIADKGYARTTLTDVARHAGLSHGLVNFHFENKEKLLAETLQFMSREYQDNWMAAVEAAPKRPADQLNALILADFNDVVCIPSRISAWCSFWGEAQCRPLYQRDVAANDQVYAANLEGICRDLAAEQGAAFPPEMIAKVLRVTLEGIWIELMTMITPYGRDEAKRIAFTVVATYFPKSFTEEGLRA